MNEYDRKAKERQFEILNKVNKAHTYVEKPMMKNMMKGLKINKVLLLGCGTGDESLLLKDFGASEIVGIDISKESINIAKEIYSNCDFYVGDMHNLSFNDNSFDFVYSSLAIHYSNNPEKVYKEVYRVLKKDGYFLFSVGHPLRWASEKVNINNDEFKLLGYQNSKEINKIYGNYNTFTKIEEYLACEDITFNLYIASPSAHFKMLKKSGFKIEDFSESYAAYKLKDIDYNYWYRYHEFPQFMAFLARK